MAKLMVEKHARKNIYKTYNRGENVYIRIGKKIGIICQKTKSIGSNRGRKISRRYLSNKV